MEYNYSWFYYYYYILLALCVKESVVKDGAAAVVKQKEPWESSVFGFVTVRINHLSKINTVNTKII